jgi:hypothetical protein
MASRELAGRATLVTGGSRGIVRTVGPPFACSYIGLLNIVTCLVCGKSERFKEFNRRKHAQSRKFSSLEIHVSRLILLEANCLV